MEGDSLIDDSNLPSADAYVELSLLDGGSFIGDWSKVHAGTSGKYRMYDWAFHIVHNGRHLLWDLGLDEDRSKYTPWVNRYMLDEVNHVGPRRALVAQLDERGVRPGDIDAVLFSHAHWDHCRPIRDVFPQATAKFGPGTREGCSPGHLKDPDMQWDGRYFDPECATERWEELEGPWQQFGPFDKAMDYFGDGSFWVVQAPGHMPGNCLAIARLQSGQWICLGSDCCHSRELLDGTSEIAEFCVPRIGKISLHADIVAARSTISKIRLLESVHGVRTVLAHDVSWIKEGTDEVLLALLDKHMAASRGRILAGEIP
ncbi:Metallo-hydrolase/oxidoreductase [Setomelanomma holmii]|uniref:Metallo-hydrolase/oxidoreductase n=1 Tax=Setomelanomma holmii TaxID=210430 RepID=A0A9P4LKZ3_9PLEO|nr:Metallo-hydrolase/oxidoreductase [Setomelanomma holmii]